MPEASQDTGRDAEPGRLDSVRSRRQHTWQQIQAAWARAQAIQARPPEAAGPGEPLTTPRFAQLQAQLAGMPVIERAKGVLMAQRGCDADQASDLLLQASQRSNVPVTELAERIVAKAQQPGASG